jgi:hypothetical protein
MIQDDLIVRLGRSQQKVMSLSVTVPPGWRWPSCGRVSGPRS